MTTELTEQELSPESIARQLVSEIRADPRIRELVLRELLTEDFLRLPEEHRRLVERLDQFTDQVIRLAEEIRESRDSTNRRLDALEQSQQQLTQDVQRLTQSVQRLDQGQQRLEGQVGNLRGHSYEQNCSEQIELVMVDHFADIALTDRSTINNLLLQARRDGRLTRQQFDQGRVIDIIGRGMPIGEQSEVQAVVEVSVTINEQDIHNARRRAILLQNLTGVSTRAFCVANALWSDELDDEADQLGVTLIRYEMPGFDFG